jgi:hypothetical protein
MFWKNRGTDQKAVKLSGPREVPEPVKKYLISTNNIDPGTIPFLKAVTKNSEKEERTGDIRIFDPADAEARGVKVVDYNTLTGNRDMIIAEGSYNESTRKLEMNILSNIPKPQLFSYAEILTQIERLKEPGSSLFFFMAAGSGVGGPLGRGASVIILNPGIAGKKQKKYSIYGTSVVNMQPAREQLKIFDSDNAKDIARWLAEAQQPRFA